MSIHRACARRARLGRRRGPHRRGWAPIAGGFALAQHFSLQLTLALSAILPLGVALLMFVLAIVRPDKQEAAAGEPVPA